MSFTLLDAGSENFEFQANVWNWKAALEIIRSFNIVSEGKVKQMGYNATGVKVDKEEAQLIAARIRADILPQLVPKKRMFADLSITDAPDDGTFYRDGDEQWRNYSASHDWLADLADFLEKSKGFQVF